MVTAISFFYPIDAALNSMFSKKPISGGMGFFQEWMKLIPYIIVFKPTNIQPF